MPNQIRTFATKVDEDLFKRLPLSEEAKQELYEHLAKTASSAVKKEEKRV